MIPFNRPFLSGQELEFIKDAIDKGKISGDGYYTEKCHQFFRERFKFQKTLLTTSCTDALEMCALLLNIGPGDEIIAPAYTFVSTVNAFILRGAKIVFIDSQSDNPNLDANLIEEKITDKTKAIICVHYAGVACDMSVITSIGKKFKIPIIEDAAQAIDSYYKGHPLGSFGDLAAFSFHETKNIISGEGGLLVINNPEFNQRAEIIREKGTNRSQFFRGEVNKYGWVDVGSSFLPSDLIAAFLYGQLQNLDIIQDKRRVLWNQYQACLQPLRDMGYLSLPTIPEFASNNAHMYYIVVDTVKTRGELIAFLKENGVHAVFHYLSLNKSEYYLNFNPLEDFTNSDKYTDCLLRLPLFYDLQLDQVVMISNLIKKFYCG